MRVAIVGGSVAGAFLALELRDSRHKVLMFDPRAPWEKPCGGAVCLDTFDQFPVLKELYTLAHRPSRFRWISSTGKKSVSSATNDQWGIVARCDLNRAMLERATRAGNVRFLSERVTDFALDDQRWQVRTAENHTFEAEILIGADGARSLVRRRMLAEIPKGHLSLAVGYMVSGVPLDCVTIKTFSDLDGYLWYLPRADHVSLGIGRSLGAISYRDLWKRLELFIGEHCPTAQRERRWSALVPAIRNPVFWRIPCAGENWAVIGDAAGHVHPITGEGISYALLSAHLAAQAIIAGDLAEYDHAWRAAYGTTLHRASALLNRLAESKKAYGDSSFETVLKKSFSSLLGPRPVKMDPF